MTCNTYYEYETPNGLVVRAHHKQHPANLVERKYYDTNSMSLACTAGDCDVVDLVSE